MKNKNILMNTVDKRWKARGIISKRSSPICILWNFPHLPSCFQTSSTSKLTFMSTRLCFEYTGNLLGDLFTTYLSMSWCISICKLVYGVGDISIIVLNNCKLNSKSCLASRYLLTLIYTQRQCIIMYSNVTTNKFRLHRHEHTVFNWPLII